MTAIAAGGHQSLALASTSTVVAWGIDSFGESQVPSTLTGVTAIAAGGSHSIALIEAVAPAFTADSPALEIVAGAAYSYQFAAETAATFATAGSLPDGLTLTSGGLLAGLRPKPEASPLR
ncbi:hypothetical protein [Cryobacterium serini]|uniref:hypothetical protein n=1 Tax=Cryobacterium serini TaxID=1259201 RepID=UPI001F5449B6|nr:hypothetical protein [Cryobacterium serini]